MSGFKTLLAGAALLALLPLQAAAAEGVTLRIANRGAESFRCVALLAHFITVDVGWIGPGDHRVMTLRRDPESGSLGLGEHRGEPMMLENVICGGLDDWESSKADFRLLPVRREDARSFEARCALKDKLVCEVAPAGR